MPELEAITLIEPGSESTSARSTSPGEYTWRHPLPENKILRLGSSPVYSDWVVEDPMISRLYAFLKWDGKELHVTKRGVLKPDFPKPPENPIYFQKKKVDYCAVKPGEWFVIGQTRFRVREETESDVESPVDATRIELKEERSRAELEQLSFENPSKLIKALEQLPVYLRVVVNEAGLFHQLLKVVLNALPAADAATIVRIPPDCPPDDPKVAVVTQHVRNSAVPSVPGEASREFSPSRKLVRRAIREQRKSCLHVWSTDPGDFTHVAGQEQSKILGALHQQNATPWAICTPFQDGTQYAMYVGGKLMLPSSGSPKIKETAAFLTEYQKVVEILVGLLEAHRRTIRLKSQNEMIKVTWPMGIRKYLNDPEKLEALLQPQEKNVSVLFCDLRNYSAFAESQGENLTGAWREIQQALDTMSSVVTDLGGIVAGFRGDAVLGFWGWPETMPNQIEMTVNAALRIFPRLSGNMETRRCGLGLTHGKALVGRLGAHDLAVVDLYGPVVNLAFRLEEMTKAFGVGIVVSDEVALPLAKADPEGRQWRMRLLAKVKPRGMKKPLGAYELGVGSSWLLGDSYQVLLPIWNETVDLFTNGHWETAYGTLHDLFHDDPAAQCLRRHMDRFDRRPPRDWDGSFTPKPPET
jgi:class 3 adenylate cyclase